jgi:hypothetical protein
MKKTLPTLFLLCSFPVLAQTGKLPVATAQTDNAFELLSFEAEPTATGVDLALVHRPRGRGRSLHCGTFNRPHELDRHRNRGGPRRIR